MIPKTFEQLPKEFQKESVRHYYMILKSRRVQLVLKRLFDIFASLVLIVLVSPILLAISIAVSVDSKGPVFYRQVRVTTLGKRFRIFKFRTMVTNADKIGTAVTVSNDARVTKVGQFLRKYRLDELPQLFDVFRGTMSFVGTRPEVEKYVKAYKEEYLATLLLPAGITSTASICYKDESRLLDASKDVDGTYINDILPDKMKYNLEDIEKFSIGRELKIMLGTVKAVFSREG